MKARLEAEKPFYMDRQRALLDARYDLSDLDQTLTSPAEEQPLTEPVARRWVFRPSGILGRQTMTRSLMPQNAAADEIVHTTGIAYHPTSESARVQTERRE